jgi:hypothetical protein
MKKRFQLGRISERNVIFKVLRWIDPLETSGRLWKTSKLSRDGLISTYIRPLTQLMIKSDKKREKVWNFKNETELIFFLKVLRND